MVPQTFRFCFFEPLSQKFWESTKQSLPPCLNQLLAPVEAGGVCVLLLWSLDPSFPRVRGNGHNLVSVLSAPSSGPGIPLGSFSVPQSRLQSLYLLLSPIPSINPCIVIDHESSPFQLVPIWVSWTSRSVHPQPPFCSHTLKLPSSQAPAPHPLSHSSWVTHSEFLVPTMISSAHSTSPCSLCSPSFFGSEGCPLSLLPSPLCVLLGPPLPALQVFFF